MATEAKRFRLSVPTDDDVVLAWCTAQHNLSMSLRMLVREYNRKHGCADVFSTGGAESIVRPAAAVKAVRNARREAEQKAKEVVTPEVVTQVVPEPVVEIPPVQEIVSEPGPVVHPAPQPKSKPAGGGIRMGPDALLTGTATKSAIQAMMDA